MIISYNSNVPLFTNSIHWTKILQNACLCSGLVPKSNIHCVENLPRSLETGHFLLVCDSSFVSETTGDLTITKVTKIIVYEFKFGNLVKA